MSIKQCPECFALDSFLVDSREGNVVCQSCGRVQQSRIIDEYSESRNFAKEATTKGEGDLKRIGSANISLLSDSGLATYISDGGLGSQLTKISQRSTHSAIDKTLNKGFRNLEDYCRHLNLADKVEEESKKIFKFICEKKALKGRQHLAVIAACIFMAARKTYQSRSIKELSIVMQVDRSDIHRSISLIQKHMPSRWKLTPAAEYAEQLAVHLGFPQRYIKYTKVLAQRTSDKGLVTGKNPMSVAAASVYMIAIVAGLGRALAEVSEVASKKDVTIRNCYRIMCIHKYDLLAGFDSGFDLNRLVF